MTLVTGKLEPKAWEILRAFRDEHHVGNLSNAVYHLNNGYAPPESAHREADRELRAARAEIKRLKPEIDHRELFDTLVASGWPYHDHWHDGQFSMDMTNDPGGRRQTLRCLSCGSAWWRDRRQDGKGWKKAHPKST